MFPKKQVLTRSLILKNLGLLLLLVPFKMFSQKPVTRIHTDWKGYWTAAAKTSEGNRPDDANNLLAFTWEGKTYSTGVNDNILISKNVTYIPQRFRALKIQTLGLDSGMYILQGSMIDGDLSKAILIPGLVGSSATGAELASRLTDGMNGLSLGTGVANIKKATISEFKIGTDNLNLTGIKDGIPDLIVTQVADTGGDADIFKFVDKDGKTVGNELSIKFESVSAVGTYSLDLFKADGGSNGFSPAATRDIRILGIETKDFGITESNSALVDRFVVSFSGSSDCAFIAFNTNSLKIAELSLVKKGILTSCGKEGGEIKYTFEITNTGEVPITNIKLTDPKVGMTISGGTIASLAVGEKATINGSYIITAADVAIGKVINSAKVTGIDPSLNVVEDLSGETNQDDRPTETILLAAPIVGTITNTSCSSATGSVFLSNLPNGAWTIDRTPSATPINGTGTSTTISNLPIGNYTFTVRTPAGCKSPSSTIATITNQSTTTWNGSTWSHGIPDATKNVVIAGAISITSDLTACSCTINPGIAITVPSGRTLNISNALTVSSTSTLTFENKSSLLQTSNDPNINSGKINYERITLPIRKADYVYWSSPVKGQTLAGVSNLTGSSFYYAYNGSNWVSTAKTSIMTVGKGYIIRGPETYSNTERKIYPATFNGTPNNGNLSGETVAANKFYLIGNPYPSALDAEAFILANKLILEGSLYFWTHNTPVVLGGAYEYASDDYATYNLSGSVKTMTAAPSGVKDPENYNVQPSGKIGAGQSFFANTKASGSIIFNNSMRRGGSDNGQFFKPGNTAKATVLEKNRIWLNMTNAGGVFKQLLVGYIEGATNDYEGSFDAETFDGNKYLDFYSVNNERKLVIQGRSLPFSEKDTVQLGYRSTLAGDFTISIDETDGSMNTQSIYLEDKTTGKIHDLSTANYTFTAEKGTFDDRFILRYTNKTLGTGDFENVENGLLVSVKNKTIKVNSAKENIKEVSIYDISGKQLYSKNKIGTSELQISNLKSGSQILLVKVILENDFMTTRKIIFL